MTLVANLQLNILPQRPRSSSTCTTKLVCSLKDPTTQHLSSSSTTISLLPKLISFALALSLNSSSAPALAIPSLSSSQPLTTPFTQSKFVQTGLLNGVVPSPLNLSSFPDYVNWFYVVSLICAAKSDLALPQTQDVYQQIPPHLPLHFHWQSQKLINRIQSRSFLITFYHNSALLSSQCVVPDSCLHRDWRKQ